MANNILVRSPSDSRILLYSELLGLFSDLLKQHIKDFGYPEDIIVMKNSSDKNINRAPLIVLQRGEVTAQPTVQLSERVAYQDNNLTSITGHILNYAIIFECFGNTYAEAESLGNLAMELSLSMGQSPISAKHANVSGIRLDRLTQSELVTPTNNIYRNFLSINAIVIVGGISKY